MGFSTSVAAKVTSLYKKDLVITPIMNAKLILGLFLACIILEAVVGQAGTCKHCNRRLGQCKRPCRIYVQPLRRHECKLPCYRRAIYCLNVCERKNPFDLQDLDDEDANVIKNKFN